MKNLKPLGQHDALTSWLELFPLHLLCKRTVTLMLLSHNNTSYLALT